MEAEFGLLGKSLDHSYSKDYFIRKFHSEGYKNLSYQNFEMQGLDALPKLIASHPNLKGFNVTHPFKHDILGFVQHHHKDVVSIGAANVVALENKNGIQVSVAYNTDWIGFYRAIQPKLEPQHKNALVLGTGGSSKAVAFALEKLGISYKFVSRNPVGMNQISYDSLNACVFSKYKIIINCTPIGMFPKVDEKSLINFQWIGSTHLVFDLIYNPSETNLLKNARLAGATTMNGAEMLAIQAEESWKIWQKAHLIPKEAGYSMSVK